MASRSHRNALPEGYKLHWYKIDKILGEGGFGITYHATDTNLDRPVAIKEYLPSDLAIRDTDSTLQPISEDRNEMYTWGLSRFKTEAQTRAKFSHHNVVRVYNVFGANNTAYMVMEFEHGQSLEHMVKTNQLQSEESILEILFPILDALENVHKTNIIHRDIKPANIYIREDGSPVLLDFGSARMAMGSQTKTLTSVVSPGFAPFEQYNPAGTRQGPWTDIYALGATLYAIISGRGPQDAIVRSNAKLEGEDVLQPALTVGKGRYSFEFLQAIDMALEFMPDDRPQSVAEWRSMFPEYHSSNSGVSHVPQEDIATIISEKKKSKRAADVHKTKPLRRGRESSDSKKWIAIPAVVIFAVILLFITRGHWQPLLSEITFDSEQAEIENKLKAIEQARLEEEKNKREQLAAATKKKNKVQFDSLMKEARLAMDKEDDVLAAKMLKLAINLHPDDMVAKLNLQRIEEKMNARKSQSKQINSLLATAEDYMKKNKLSSPQGENAADIYKQVLNINPDNQIASIGIKNIVRSYLSLSKTASDQSNFDKASGYLSTAAGVLPDLENFDSSRQNISEARARLRSAVDRFKKQAKAQQLAKAKQQQEEVLRKKAEADKQARFKRLVIEAQAAFEQEEKDLAIEKYSLALKLFPDNEEAIRGLLQSKKMEYKACKQIVGEWLWSVGTTTVVKADGTFTSSFLFVSIPGTWSCVDGKERKFDFTDQRTYTITMSKDGNRLHAQGITATRQKSDSSSETQDEEF